MLRVLLVNPWLMDARSKEYDANTVPIGLYYIGALLIENGFQTEIINLADKNAPFQHFKTKLKTVKPQIIGFSILNANRLNAMACAAEAKHFYPNTKVVFGGPSATFLAEFFFSNLPQLDFIVKGEGEITFLELVQAVELKNESAHKKIKGLIYRQGNTVFHTEKRSPVINLDILPPPGRYFDFQHVILSRGCPGSCSFCGSPSFWGEGRIRFHSAVWFVDHLEILYSKGITHFLISDDTFTFDKQRVLDICKKIVSKKLKITWAAISRIDFITEEMLYWMRKSGCIQVSYGVESGDAKIRKTLGKPIKEKTIIETFRLTGFYGILPRAYFIYGSPGETKKTIQNSVDLILKIKPLSMVFYVLMVFPGTRIYHNLKNQRLVSDNIWQNPVEDIPWFEFDPELSFEDIKIYGQKLRGVFYKNLDKFASRLKLVDDSNLYPEHADFLARLAMTFSHGEYADNREIPDSDKTAEVLFEKALSYNPDPKAYLGLSMLLQKRKEFKKACRVARKGVEMYPEDRDLNICMGVCLMNLGAFESALPFFKKFETAKDIHRYIEICKKKSDRVE